MFLTLSSLGGAAVATVVLALVARSVGWVDRFEAAPARKRRGAAVPLVGGVAIVLGALIGIALAGIPGRTWSLDVLRESIGAALPGYAWPALLAALGLGLLDDLVPRGLAPIVKLVGQLAVAALVFAYPGVAHEGADPSTRWMLAGLALVAMNAINLFDHADGMAGSVGGMALVGPAPALGGAILGFLPFNTFIRGPRDPETDERPSFAMLGDAGAHVIGVAMATIPGAAWLLFIPLLDLVTVVEGRLRRGVPIWRGDRTHLGHRLAGLGLGPVAVALLVAGIVCPPFVARMLSPANGPLGVGLLVSLGLYLIVLVAADAPDPDPDERDAEREAAQRKKLPVESTSGPFDAVDGDFFPASGEAPGLIRDTPGPSTESSDRSSERTSSSEDAPAA